MGHEPTVAPDGEQAWRIVQSGLAPLLISDWMMPLVDGPELCRRIRSATLEKYTYIILLTSRDRKEDRLEGLRAGADDFLTKPPDPDELTVRLEIAERILKVHAQLARQNERLAELAAVDELTGTKNRRRFREDLELLFAQAERLGSPLSLIMLDIDHFKEYNDAFGHPAGDEILRRLGSTLRSALRGHDVVARYGGEEFVVLLAGDRRKRSDRSRRALASAIAKAALAATRGDRQPGRRNDRPAHRRRKRTCRASRPSTLSLEAGGPEPGHALPHLRAHRHAGGNTTRLTHRPQITSRIHSCRRTTTGGSERSVARLRTQAWNTHSSPPTWKYASLDDALAQAGVGGEGHLEAILAGLCQIEPVVQVEPHGLEDFERLKQTRRFARVEVSGHASARRGRWDSPGSGLPRPSNARARD